MSQINKPGRLAPGVLAVLIAIATTVALAAQASADSTTASNKVDLLHTASISCDTGASPGPATGSFIVIHPGDTTSSSPTLGATVSLKHADPEAIYNVYLVQTPLTPDNPTCYPGVLAGTITTNAEGNGNGFFSAPQYSATTGAFVSVWDGPHGGGDYQATATYTFGSK
ncbi:MAG: hypothetical protein ACYDHH_02210 [Solirubrobacteraceae bacterium]